MAKRASSRRPISSGVADAPLVALTIPAAEIVTPVASLGTLMLGMQRVALRRDEHALVGDLEGAVARVGELPAGRLDLEEALALDRDVERAVRRLERALPVHALHAGEPRAAPDLDRGRRLALGLSDDGGALHGLIEQVLEVRAAALEAGRVHVREVVRDDFGAELLRDHAAGGGAEGGVHDEKCEDRGSRIGGRGGMAVAIPAPRSPAVRRACRVRSRPCRAPRRSS